MGVCGQSQAPAALPPRKTGYPLYKGLGRPQGWSGRVRKILPSLEFDPRPVQSVATRYTDYAISAQGRGGCYCVMFRVYLGISTEWLAL